MNNALRIYIKKLMEEMHKNSGPMPILFPKINKVKK